MNDKMRRNHLSSADVGKLISTGLNLFILGNEVNPGKSWKIRFVDKSKLQTLELSENYDELNVFR